jgi:hypothetical protein
MREIAANKALSLKLPGKYQRLDWFRKIHGSI